MAAEVAVGVALSAATAGAGAAAKSINLPRKLEKLADKSDVFKFLLTPRVMNKMKAANARLAHLLGTALCFAAGTPVHTADGLRPIESIRPGDLVWTRRDDGPADAPLVLRAVEAALVTDSSALLHLTVRTEGGDEETLATTPNHPFYDLGRATFVAAEELALGDELCLADGRRATVSAARREDAPDGKPFRTYNLSVDEGRTYFAGRLGAWVHNTGAGWETACKLVSVQVRDQLKAAPNLPDDAVLQLIEEAIEKHGGADADAFTRKKHLRDVVEYLTNPNDPDNPALPDGRRESLLEAIDAKFEASSSGLKPLVEGFDFGKHLRGLIGDPPSDMLNPHAHHILFKKGLGPAQQALVNDGQAILRKVGIDPIYGKENLVWAPFKISLQHGPASLNEVVSRLKQLDAIGGDYDDFVKLLKELGQKAAARK
ncbi:MAG: polymorphic toxin-type HINT domain-containing protein [Planctomycetia bacterium]